MFNTVKETDRGFQIIRFLDAYGKECSIQQSSAIGDYDDGLSRPGSSFVWIGLDDVSARVMARDAASVGVKTDETTGWVEYPIPECVTIATRMHINREQAQMLIERLTQWLASGEFTH